MAKRRMVYLVGAGPGDPELLTVKAARVLAEADVVLYDSLVCAELLALAPPRAELVYVGKEAGKPCPSQEEINARILAAALRQNAVVRLKGGDPFVFGRGGEEALFLRERGIPFEIVPGVSSSIAAAAYAGIPVTHRNVACSFAVVTGHEASGKLQTQVDWASLRGVGTVVVLMGVQRRAEIAAELIAAGRRVDEPVAFVENGTTPAQRTVRSTLREVAEAPPEVASPAVMVVGDVVDLADRLAWFNPEEAARAPAAAHAETTPPPARAKLVPPGEERRDAPPHQQPSGTRAPVAPHRRDPAAASAATRL
ncbi:MAG: uroporphyrinogen-III C-methyltransferase [Deltaproteobacteria bacterium]|nr:uroporphyrinogen-III C-methyltransferase [Deltaproteobacteria bacterium]